VDPVLSTGTAIRHYRCPVLGRTRGAPAGVSRYPVQAAKPPDEKTPGGCSMRS
jgi:hypothetical protein